MISPSSVNFILGFLAKDQYLDLIHELQYLEVYLLCLAKWNESSFGRDKNFGFLEESHIEATFEKAERKIKESGFEGCDAVSELLQKIQLCKPKIEEDCLNFFDCSFPCYFSIDEFPEFMLSISASLHNLLLSKVDMMLDVKVQIESLEANLEFFKELFDFRTKRCNGRVDLKEFEIHIQSWACRAACLSLLYWVLDVKKGNKVSKMEVIFSDLQKRISPSIPEVTTMYLAVLVKAPKPSYSGEDSLTVSKLVLKFVEFLKYNLQVDPEKDGIQMLFIDLIFLMTFLMERPKTENFAEGKLLLTRADAVLNDAATLISLLCSGEVKEGIAEEKNFHLHNFLQNTNSIKAEVRTVFASLFMDLSSFNYPDITTLGFLDSLLENFKDFCPNFPKHQIVMLREELLSLKEFNLKDLNTMQNNHEEIKYLWREIAQMAYKAERAVDSFIYIKKSLWHDILCLCDVIEEVKFIKSEVKRIWNQCDIHALDSEESPIILRTEIAVVDNFFVGKADEVELILYRLICGSVKLDIISIVGMAGLGKTTLAKKVYNDASVRFHFKKRAWCTISQTYNRKKMLLDISSHVASGGGNLSGMEEEDLAEIVYRNLKGRRYLIVMDDIWDVSAWKALKMSFPDDNNGSRIIFTSRSYEVVFEAKPGSTAFPLRVLSMEESFELLRKKLFGHEYCPPYFREIGMQIAILCKGLPLVVHLIGSFLKEKCENLDWWKNIKETLDTLSATESLMAVLDLIYRYLPEFLKPCFLYMGSFAEDEEIRVNKLIQLWIAEGFIPKHETESLEAVAEDYFMELVARSLVTITKRSSTGGIKTVGVHDLLHDFCLYKCHKENFLVVIRGNKAATSSANYRVCIETECLRSFVEVRPTSSIHSLRWVHPLSFTSSLEPESISCLTYQKFLRVLDVDNNLVFDEFPEGITELILLRYLAIMCDFKSIPPSIKRLENLETLHLHHKGWASFDLPLTMWEMRKLRHVYLTSVRIPPDFCPDMLALENVQTLSFLYLSYGAAERFLRIIPKVRKLRCSLQLSGAQEGRHQILKFDFLNHLESLTLCHDSIPIKCRGCAFYFPSTLKKLTLINFRLPWYEISPIAKLPNLEVLKLSDSFRGKTWNVGDDEFPNLKFLRLSNLDIKEWDASDESFPCLEQLEVDYCPKLEEIPSRFETSVTLKMIQVINCRTTLHDSVWQCQQEQVASGNEELEVCIS